MQKINHYQKGYNHITTLGARWACSFSQSIIHLQHDFLTFIHSHSFIQFVIFGLHVGSRSKRKLLILINECVLCVVKERAFFLRIREPVLLVKGLPCRSHGRTVSTWTVETSRSMITWSPISPYWKPIKVRNPDLNCALYYIIIISCIY